jgi:hypothetical protein
MRKHSPGPDHSEPFTLAKRETEMTSSINTTMNPGRRAFLTSVAAAAVTASVTSPAIAGGRDPILDAIDKHKAARAVVYSAVDAVCAAEQELTGRGLKPTRVRGNSPRLDACEDALSQAFKAETEAACVLVTVRPTTIEGVLALLQYANAADTDGEGWPSDLCSDDDTTRSWHYFLIEALAEVLPGMVSA